MKEFSKKEKALGVTVAALLLIFVFKVLVVDSLREKMSLAEEEINRSQLLLRKHAGLQKNRDLILQEYKKISRYMLLKGPDEEKMTQVLSKIEAEAARAGLTVLDMKPDASPRSATPPIIYRIQLNAEADLAKIVTFLYNLENAEILFRLAKLNLNLKDESTGLIKFEASILGISLS